MIKVFKIPKILFGKIRKKSEKINIKEALNLIKILLMENFIIPNKLRTTII